MEIEIYDTGIREDGFDFSLGRIWQSFRYRTKLLLATFFGVLLPFCVVLLFLPLVYTSTASVLVESNQIPQELVAAAVDTAAAERIDLIQQKVLTRTTALTIVEEFDLYHLGENPETLVVSAAVNQFLNNVEIALVSANVGSRSDLATIAFELSFSHKNPITAQVVANQLATLFLNENVTSRTQRAAETADFLTEEAIKARERMIVLENEAAKYKLENRQTMPEVFEMNLTLLERAEVDYKALILEIENRKAEINSLKLQRTQKQNAVGGEGFSLADLRRAYQEFLVENSESHPTAAKMRRQIRALEEEQARRRRQGDDDFDAIDDPVLAGISLQIRTAQNKLDFLEQDRNRTVNKLRELEKRIADTPSVEQRYTKLQRELDSARDNWNDMRGREREARITQNLESGQRGERFAILEPPLVPTEASDPDKKKWLVVGLILALSLAFVAVVTREIMDDGIRNTQAFAAELGFMPMVVVPLIANEEDREIRRAAVKKWATLLILSGGFLSLVVIHYFVRNLIPFWNSVFDFFGF